VSPPVDPTTRRALQALRGRLTEGQLRRIFSAIRTVPDDALLALLREGPAAGPKARMQDPLVREITILFRPILGPSQEKAALLSAAFARRSGLVEPFEVRGLASAIRRLRRYGTDADIRAAAEDVMTEMRARFSYREAVK
jgi:hypothetical protein